MPAMKPAGKSAHLTRVMMKIRKADERGRTQFEWLDGRHTFSFGEYYYPKHVHFRALRVINDDRVAPGGGFPAHPHRDMEIVTYVLDGALEHKDSMGNGSVIRAGDVQYMGAGAGVTHSEFNPSDTEPTHLLQIWILPEKKGLKPAYEQVALRRDEYRGKLRPLPLPIRQDVKLLAGVFQTGENASHTLTAGRHAWIHVARGSVTLNGQPLSEGDGAAVTGESALNVVASDASEVLVFDLA